MKKKRILVLASTFPRWKNDTKPPFVFELEKRLAKDFEIHVLAPHHFGAKEEEKMEGLFVHRFQYSWPASGQKLCDDAGILPNLKENKLLYFQAVGLILFELIAAIQLCRKNKFELVHAHWIIPQGIIAIIIKNIFGIPYILTSHGSDLHSLGFIAIKKAILVNAKKITVVSNYLKEEVKKIDNTLLSKVEVIPMGVDTKLFNPDKYDESIKNKYGITGKFLLFVGRLAPEKGVKYLIDAMPLVLKKYPKTKLMIIGTGSLEKELKDQVKFLNIRKEVIFLGSIKHKDLPQYYATADIFVSPSIKEGFGLTVVEAGVSGCNLIAFKSKNNASWMVENGMNGLISKKTTSILLSQSINEKLTDISKKASRSINIFDISKYDWNAIAIKYFSVYIS